MKLFIIGLVMFAAMIGAICAAEDCCNGVFAAVVAEIVFTAVFVCCFYFLDAHKDDYDREIDKILGEEK